MNQIGINGIQPGHPGAAHIKGPNGAMGRRPDSPDRLNKQKKQLNTAIYDYFLKCEAWDICRALKAHNIPLDLDDGKNGPKQEDGDSRDDTSRPSDLPASGSRFRSLGFDTAFLLDWFSMFWDIWQAAGSQDKNNLATEYLRQSNAQNRMQHQQQQVLMRQGIPHPNAMNQQMFMRGNMQRPVTMMTPQQQQMFAKRQQMMHQAAMAREGSGMDGDGQRPRTPGSGDNAPSPPKRPRLDGNPQFPGQMMPNGVSQQPDMQLGARGMIAAASGIGHPLTNVQFQNLANAHPQRAISVGQGGSPPLVQPGMDPSMMVTNNGEYYSPNSRIPANGANGANGHALQDYQMQLMLLERQNRKRLEMAKQEQTGMEGMPPNGQNMPYPPNMSPSGSRQGPSPNPSEQIKRGTPKLGQAGIPGSPMPDAAMQQRASPSAMNYNQMQANMDGGMQMAANGMRPPSSHPGGAFPNGVPMNPALMRGGQPGGPGQAQMNGGGGFAPGPGNPQGPGQMTPQPRNSAMPPPSGVPPANQNATGRASPAPSATAGTPQQSSKPAPKGKKDAGEKKRKQSVKKSTAPAAETQENAPSASAPATPITPAMPVNKAAGAAANQANAQAQGTANGQGQQNNGAGAGTVGPDGGAGTAAAAPNNTAHSESTDIFNQDSGMGLEFTTNMEAGDVLESFNFDPFMEDPPQDFSGSGFLTDFGAFEMDADMV